MKMKIRIGKEKEEPKKSPNAFFQFESEITKPLAHCIETENEEKEKKNIKFLN